MQGHIKNRVDFFVPSGLLFVLVLVMFGDVLFGNPDVVLSSPTADIKLQFFHWRWFAVEEIRKGNLPLWNPHILSGMPYLAGFQSAMLYPPNLVYLAFPIARAINVGIALHVFLGGVFAYLWTAKWKIHPLACFFAASAFMFCGPHFLHIHAGHLPNLCAMTWVPLILLAVDGTRRDVSGKWFFLGAFAVAMQILAGHPQYVFYTAVAVFLYGGVLLVNSAQRMRVAALVASMYIGGAVLAAVQLFPGIAAAEESIRSKGLSFEFARQFSLSPENLLTLFVPGLFGDMVRQPYWGRFYLWEMSLFFSVTGLALAVYALAASREKRACQLLFVCLALLILALGDYTPLFRFLYDHLPGFDKFRGTSKFIFQAILFLILLSAMGLDALLKRGVRRPGAAFGICIGAATVAMAIGILIGPSADSARLGIWPAVMQAMASTGETYGPSPSFYSDAEMVGAAGAFAARGLFFFALTSALLGLLLFFSGMRRECLYLIVLLGVIELFTFARLSRATFSASEARPEKLATFIASLQGDDRVLAPKNPNVAMSVGAYDIWGYDPGVPRRYAEFMAFSQGMAPESADQNIVFHRPSPLFDLLRCRYGVLWTGEETHVYELSTTTMPTAALMYDWIVRRHQEEILPALFEDRFDFKKTVVLEEDPGIAKAPEGAGVVRVARRSTDYFELEIATSSSAVLLITESYSKSWKAYDISPGGKNLYEVLPADHALMAIPLTAGRHRIGLDYLPESFVIGKWTSISGLFCYAIAGIYCIRRNRNRPEPSS